MLLNILSLGWLGLMDRARAERRRASRWLAVKSFDCQSGSWTKFNEVDGDSATSDWLSASEESTLCKCGCMICVCVCDESQWEERTEPWTDKRVSSHLRSTSDGWSELSSRLRHEKTGFSPCQHPWTKFWPLFKRFWLPVNMMPVFFQPGLCCVGLNKRILSLL